MNYKSVTYTKLYKKNLGEYNSINVGMEIVVEYQEDEDFNHKEVWDRIDTELIKQLDKEELTEKEISNRERDSILIEHGLPPVEEKTFEKEMEEIADASQCPIHKVTMKEREGKFGKFYSHSRQLPDQSWDYCSGKGYNSELK